MNIKSKENEKYKDQRKKINVSKTNNIMKKLQNVINLDFKNTRKC